MAELSEVQAKHARRLPGTSDERVRAVEQLDKLFAEGIRVAQDERAKALLCVRTLEAFLRPPSAARGARPSRGGAAAVGAQPL